MAGDDKNINGVWIAGLLALTGTIVASVINGYWERESARQEHNSNVILEALKAGSEKDRIESLKLMVDVGVLDDPLIRKRVNARLAEDAKNEDSYLPQIAQSTQIERPNTGLWFAVVYTGYLQQANITIQAACAVLDIVDTLDSDPIKDSAFVGIWSTSDNERLAITIGGPTSRENAQKLRNFAVDNGLANDAFFQEDKNWNPYLNGLALIDTCGMGLQ